MKKAKKILFWVLLTALLINFIPTFYFGKPIEGVVVDESGVPIENAVILLSFSIETTDFLHSTKRHKIFRREFLRVPVLVSFPKPFER